MDPITALRRSLLLQLVGVAACHGGGPDGGDTEVAETDTSDDVVSACGTQTDVRRLPRGEPGGRETGRLIACSDAIATVEDCLTRCLADCQQEIADQLSWAGDTGGGGESYRSCGPVWVDGACCVVADVSRYVVGRPLRVGDAARTAPARAGDGWAPSTPTVLPPAVLRDALVHAWTARALAEHASVASFARVQLELLGLGAPADLVADAAAAMADEVAHARACLGVASAWAGRALGPGPLDLTGVVPSTDAAAVLVDTLVEGCVGETIGAAEAAVVAEACADPALAAVLRGIAEDEARHAALAWRTVRWLVAAHPELGGLVAPTLARALDAADAGGDDGAGLSVFGVLDGAARRAVVRRVRDEVVGPVAAALAA